MKRKIFTLLLSACMGTMVMAQAPNVVVKKASVAPIIDGVVDDVWADASKQNIDQPFQAETPTLGEAGTTTWQALWNDDGIFILLQVNDDEFYPAYMNNNDADWKYDKPEIYFDVNAEKKDGIGGGGGKGHYQFAPGFVEATIDGTVIDDGTSGMHAFKVTAPTYKAEYFFPFSKFLDQDGSDLDMTQPIGFDVTIIDGESAAPGIRQRAVWTNVGAVNESYNNMDDCGTITLSSFDGAIIAKATAAPVLDGEIDDVWASATAYNIDQPFQAETPTLGESGETTWQALWNDDGIFLLLKVTDDEFYPAYMNNNDADWKYDKPEVYFDVNTEKKDGIGGGGGNGHYQFAPGFAEATIDGTLIDDGVNGMHAFKVTAPNYVAEYFFPFAKFLDKDGVEVNKANPIGFDVTIIDGESAAPGIRQRAVWSNVGAINESYNNMDDCALVMLDGAASYDDVENITVTGGSITTDDGTLQMVAVVEPSSANQKVKWVVENGTGRATIDSKGVLTGIVNGKVLVKAISKDGLDVEGKTTVEISGQIVKMSDIDMIKNGNFELGADGKQSWGSDASVGGTVEDGWYNLVCTPLVNMWSLMVTQANVPIADAETPYTIKFKAVATNDMLVPMLFEDRNNGSSKTVTSLSEYRDNGYGKWDFPVTTEPQWFTVDAIFSALAENSAMELNFQVGQVEGTLSLDSIMMYADADLALLTSVPTLSNVNKVQLYPNPVQTVLTISKIAVANSKVSVYNSVGQKLMEKTANGTQAKFDVANLRKGMYFVRFSDGSSQKFIRQ